VLAVCTFTRRDSFDYTFLSQRLFFDEAKRWFEAATVICRFVPGGRERADKVSLQSSFCCKRDAYGASFFLCRSQNRMHNCSLDIIKHGPCEQPPRLVEPMHSTQTLRKRSVTTPIIL